MTLSSLVRSSPRSVGRAQPADHRAGPGRPAAPAGARAAGRRERADHRHDDLYRCARAEVVDTQITETDRGCGQRHRRCRRHPLDQLARPLAHRDRVRRGRDIDEAANDVRDAVGRVSRACPRRPTSRRSSRPTATPTRSCGSRSPATAASPAGDHRLRRALHRRPAGDDRRRGAGADLRPAALRHAHLARSARDGGARPDRRGHRADPDGAAMSSCRPAASDPKRASSPSEPIAG